MYRQPPFAERLETRRLLAATLVNGTLIVTGDSADNDITISRRSSSNHTLIDKGSGGALPWPL
jgi:hypothetical protein